MTKIFPAFIDIRFKRIYIIIHSLSSRYLPSSYFFMVDIKKSKLCGKLIFHVKIACYLLLLLPDADAI